MYVCICIYTYVCMYVCIYVCMYLCMHVGNEDDIEEWKSKWDLLNKSYIVLEGDMAAKGRWLFIYLCICRK